MRGVIWNIGEIASSHSPDALKLVRDILLASASIPVAFPPVYIQVAADGQVYDELHVDGGAAAQVFLAPITLDWKRLLDKFNIQGRPEVYVIRNALVTQKLDNLRPKILPIAGRSVSSMIRTQGIGDLLQIYYKAKREGIDYRLAYIPKSFEAEPEEEFDRAYMNQLFQLGYEMALNGYPWEETPFSYVQREAP